MEKVYAVVSTAYFVQLAILGSSDQHWRSTLDGVQVGLGIRVRLENKMSESELVVESHQCPPQL